MTQKNEVLKNPPAPAALNPAIESACSRMAPTWPLDRFIAVNPLWGHIERPLPEVAATLAGLTGQ